jgi:hypothetical protein
VRLGATHILRLQTFRSAFDLKLHLGAFLEGPVTGHLNGRKVDKYVLAARALDKSIAFGGVKPFHNTLFSHYWYLLFHSRLSAGRSFRVVPALGSTKPKTFATVKLPAIVACEILICKKKTL